MKLVGYVRVSSRSQQDNSSLDAQVEAIKKECEYRGYTLAKIFTEVKSASGTVDRHQFDSALHYMEDSNCNGLIVYDIDRYFRNVADGLTTFKRYFSDGNYLFVSVNQRFDTQTDEGWFMFTMFLLNAEYERRKIASRTGRGKEYLAKQGCVVTASPKYQFDVKHKLIDGKMRKIAVENPERVALVRQIKEFREEKYTLTSIADWLNKKGVPTSRGCKWTPKQVARLLV